MSARNPQKTKAGSNLSNLSTLFGVRFLERARHALPRLSSPFSTNSLPRLDRLDRLDRAFRIKGFARSNLVPQPWTGWTGCYAVLRIVPILTTFGLGTTSRSAGGQS